VQLGSVAVSKFQQMLPKISKEFKIVPNFFTGNLYRFQQKWPQNRHFPNCIDDCSLKMFTFATATNNIHRNAIDRQRQTIAHRLEIKKLEDNEALKIKMICQN
jgi:hypothetical protein